ncbi:MAG: Fe-S cluster assembly protein SufD [Phycisphaeraceae bacterium]
MTSATSMTIEQHDELGHFEALAQQRADVGPAWLRAVREQAVKDLRTVGLPTRKHEEWRYTDPAPLTRTRFALSDTPPAVAPGQFGRFTMPGLDAHTLVFVNGRYVASLSQVGKLPAGVVVCPLADALDAHRDTLEPLLATHGEASSAAFTLLNAATLDDGLFVSVPAGVTLDRPVQVLNVAIAERKAAAPLLTSPRNVIIAGENSELTIVEQYVSLDDAAYFTNAVTQVDAGASARLGHYLIERESPAAYQVSTLLTEQGRDSDVNSHTVLLGGKLVRNNVNPRLIGPGGHCLVNGLYLGDDAQQMDNHMRVEHRSPHCDSRQFYKGVLQGQARAVFSGRIYVERGAQKTDAKQENSNLLLSRDAEATTKPQLEIFADDVKCTHGATVGEIDEQAVFYLMARGMERDAARALMIYAFAAESLERMRLEPVRAMLTREILARLPEGERLASLV